MATSFILWWCIAGLVWILLLSRKMADKFDRSMEILGLWLLAVFSILGLPQYFPSPLGIQLSIIITASAAIGITLFLCLGRTDEGEAQVQPRLPPEIVVERVSLGTDEIPRELHVRLRRGGEVKHEAHFHFLKVESQHGSVDDLRVSFSINGSSRRPMRIFACPLKETYTVTQPSEIDVVPTDKDLEEFAIAFLNDDKWGHDTIALSEGAEYNFLLFFALKGMYCAYIPSNTRRYLIIPSKYRLDLYLEGTGLPLYKAASLDIEATSWNVFGVKHLSDLEAQVPKIVVSPAEDDSKNLKEIRVSRSVLQVSEVS